MECVGQEEIVKKGLATLPQAALETADFLEHGFHNAVLLWTPFRISIRSPGAKRWLECANYLTTSIGPGA
jgi:hypothetical protein